MLFDLGIEVVGRFKAFKGLWTDFGLTDELGLMLEDWGLIDEIGLIEDSGLIDEIGRIDDSGLIEDWGLVNVLIKLELESLKFERVLRVLR